MHLSIRWRLTLWNALGMAVVLAGFTALVYGLMVRAHYERIDRALEDQLRDLRESPDMASAGRERWRHWLSEVQEHARFRGAVYGADGMVYEHSEDMPLSGIPPAPAASTALRFQEVNVPNLGRHRLVSAQLAGEGGPYSVVLLAPLEEVDQELRLLLSVLLLAVPIALLALTGWSYLMARAALAPMERLRRSTEEITAARLDRRLPIANAKDELGRLSRTINAMIARLERSFLEIRRFTADASHELRTPLAIIRTEAEVALDKHLSPAEHRDLLGGILEECERLTRLIEQLLALAREDAGAGAVAFQPIELSALIQQVVEDMRPLAEAQGLTILVEVDGPLPISGEESRLQQVFYNLLDNAIKYTPAAGTITVRVERTDRGVVVTVHDTGIGIPPEHLPHVFDRFYRVDKARSRAEGGTGLGLSIAQCIIAAHGGRIELASTPGHGTTCTVALPLGAKLEKRLDSKEAL
jgi:two-component system heavy metal sensor histidine kinase CusS